MSFPPRSLNSSEETIKVFNLLREKGKKTSKCSACNRPMDEHETKVFEDHVSLWIVFLGRDV